MMDERQVNEIDSLKRAVIAFQAVRGESRRLWPRAIKEQAVVLMGRGMELSTLSAATGLDAGLLCKWRRVGGRVSPRPQVLRVEPEGTGVVGMNGKGVGGTVRLELQGCIVTINLASSGG